MKSVLLFLGRVAHVVLGSSAGFWVDDWRTGEVENRWPAPKIPGKNMTALSGSDMPYPCDPSGSHVTSERAKPERALPDCRKKCAPLKSKEFTSWLCSPHPYLYTENIGGGLERGSP